MMTSSVSYLLCTKKSSILLGGVASSNHHHQTTRLINSKEPDWHSWEFLWKLISTMLVLSESPLCKFLSWGGCRQSLLLHIDPTFCPLTHSFHLQLPLPCAGGKNDKYSLHLSTLSSHMRTSIWTNQFQRPTSLISSRGHYFPNSWGKSLSKMSLYLETYIQWLKKVSQCLHVFH